MRFVTPLLVALSGTGCILASPVVLSPRTPHTFKHKDRQRLSTPKVAVGISVANTISLVVSNGDNSASRINSTNSRSKYKNSTATAHTQYSANWSGAIVHGTGYETVTGTIVVPRPQIPSGHSPEKFYGASAWVGLDGDSDCPGAILQVGIDFNIQNGTVDYDAWFEWFPDYAYNFVGFPLHAGDVVTLTATAVNTRMGSVIIENKTTAQSVVHTFVGEMQPLCQTSAEWIIEDYSVGGELVGLCDWGRATFTDCEAKQFSGTTASLSDATIYDISGNGNVMTDCSIFGNDIVTCKYTG
ncbi:hypothetical protein SEPCBS57363_006297 [Sporothrix epigloea]|uniref:Aspergillopepsin n=1 Tax=Sporothrix epigloea TaxID=1892477 RepID=A0ABP0E2B4_9PEZI